MLRYVHSTLYTWRIACDNTYYNTFWSIHGIIILQEAAFYQAYILEVNRQFILMETLCQKIVTKFNFDFYYKFKRKNVTVEYLLQTRKRCRELSCKFANNYSPHRFLKHLQIFKGLSYICKEFIRHPIFVLPVSCDNHCSNSTRYT